MYILKSFAGSLIPVNIRVNATSAKEARLAIRKLFPLGKVKFSQDRVTVTSKREKLCLFYQHQLVSMLTEYPIG